jgi:adenine-specific DNA-methyltransferase
LPRICHVSLERRDDFQPSRVRARRPCGGALARRVAPDVRLHAENAGAVVSVELRGVDLYDPTTGETSHDKGENVAAWLVDHDYDGRSFCICQVLFPAKGMKNPWEKLQKAHKGTVDDDKFEPLRTTRSVPYKPGKKVAVIVIDDRWQEGMQVVDSKVTGGRG